MMHALMANLALSYNTDVKHSTISFFHAGALLKKGAEQLGY